MGKIEEKNEGDAQHKIKKENSVSLKILLVDDEPSLLQLIGIRVSGWGHDLITAANGVEAINALINKKPDIIILDYYLPGGDGITTLQKIRDIDQKVIVIMLTAHPTKDALMWANQLNVRALIPKCEPGSDMCSSLKVIIDAIAEEK